jgi:hypothetical protein
MTNTRGRATQRQYLAAAFVGVCSSNEHRMPSSWQEQADPSNEGSPP